jgi:hypothetical protein
VRLTYGWHWLQHLFLHINISARCTARLHYYAKGSRLVAMIAVCLEYKWVSQTRCIYTNFDWNPVLILLLNPPSAGLLLRYLQSGLKQSIYPIRVPLTSTISYYPRTFSILVITPWNRTSRFPMLSRSWLKITGPIIGFGFISKVRDIYHTYVIPLTPLPWMSLIFPGQSKTVQ